jgi:hypothetical protein
MGVWLAGMIRIDFSRELLYLILCVEVATARVRWSTARSVAVHAPDARASSSPQIKLRSHGSWLFEVGVKRKLVASVSLQKLIGGVAFSY